METQSFERQAPEGPGTMAEERRANGPPLAAVVAAAFGCFVLGAFTTLAEVSPSLKDWLMFRDPVGPLSGKTTLAVVGWLLAWAVLGLAWRGKDVDSRTWIMVSAVLIGLGFVGTFPSFFERFTAE